MKQVLGILLLLFLIGCTVAERGDVLQVTYAGRYTNGTMFDTNDPQYIGNVSKLPSQFVPLQVTLGRGQVVKGFEQALYGMKKGETKTVTIKAVDAYGGYNADKIVPVPKHFSVQKILELNRRLDVPRSSFNQEVVVGTVFDTEHFRYNVTGSNDTHVFLYMLNATTDPITFPEMSWNSTLRKANATTLVYEHLITPGEVYFTPRGPYKPKLNGSAYEFTTIFKVGQDYALTGGQGRAIRETDNTIYIDFNHPLAGEDLVFTITVEDIKRP